MSRPSTRVLLAALLLVSLVLAGAVSLYASSRPDGLERVAADQGIGEGSRSATDGSPLADYETDGVGDPRLSGAVAGVVGALTVLVLAGGLAFVVRRRAGG